MGYGLKRLQEIEAEKKAKKAEKERIKAEKEKVKKEEQRIKRKKRLKSKNNRRQYVKRRAIELERRREMGDEYAFFTVLVVKNGKRVKRIGAAWWKTDAYAKFNEAIEENQKTVKMPILFTTSHTNTVREKNKQDTEYEIIIVKKLTDPEESDRISHFRNEMGKMTEHVIVDKTEHVIVDKHEWLVPETFNVYGYHPQKDRKDYHFIFDNLILNNEKDKYDEKQLLTYSNKLFISYLDDFDFVICKTPSEAQRLYSTIMKDVDDLKLKGIYFMGEINDSMSTLWLNKMEEKTGWTRELCKKPYVI